MWFVPTYPYNIIMYYVKEQLFLVLDIDNNI